MGNYKLDALLSDFLNKTDRIVKREELIHYLVQYNEKNVSSGVSNWLRKKKSNGELKSFGKGLYQRNVEVIPCKLFELQKAIGIR